jgi:uncharacterized protein (DUF58 family)
MPFKNYILDCFLNNKFFVVLGVCICLFVASFYIIALWHIAIIATIILGLLTLLEYALLFFTKNSVVGVRVTAPRFSNGDDNKVSIVLHNTTRLHLKISIVDELPVQFQKRDFKIDNNLKAFEKKKFVYNLRPTQRGVYQFFNVWVYYQTALGFITKRVIAAPAQEVKVYPSYLQLRNARLKSMATTQEIGESKATKLSSSLEFDHIKEYVLGDDIRNINWKATARKNQFMVNTYTDERSQQVYCIIDMGRIMKMPFNGLSLLDYSINSALMLSYMVLHKNDKIGLVTFTQKVNSFLKANRNNVQMARITELLYKQETAFLESNYEALINSVKHYAGQRSLIMLYTNFETLNSVQRHMPYLKLMAAKHLLCVIIFENETIKEIHNNYKDTLEGIYVKTIADKYHYEKKRIIKELQKEGIMSIFTTPENLSASTINKYLELKNKRII